MMGAKILHLPADLDGLAAASLFEVLTPLVGTDIMIDASHVERIGGLSLQILLAAVSTWKVDGGALEFTNLSLDFVTGLELLGICPQLFSDRELTQ